MQTHVQTTPAGQTPAPSAAHTAEGWLVTSAPETVATGHISQPHLEPPEISDTFLGGFLTPDKARDTTGDPGDPPPHSHSGWCRRQAQLLLGRKVSFRARTTSILSFKDESCLPPGPLGSAGPTVRYVGPLGGAFPAVARSEFSLLADSQGERG